MAELSPQAAGLIVGTFLRRYNQQHGSAFTIKTAEPDDDQSCDYLSEDPQQADAPLKIQLTRAVPQVETTTPCGLVLECSARIKASTTPTWSSWTDLGVDH